MYYLARFFAIPPTKLFSCELKYRLHFVAYGQLSFEVVAATKTNRLASSDARQLMLLLMLGLLRGLNAAP